MQILTKNAYPSAIAIQQLLLCLEQNLRIEIYPFNLITFFVSKTGLFFLYYHKQKVF